MAIGTLRVTEAIPAWKTVLDISELVPQDSWMLVGGLMTQVHAGLAGLASRGTRAAGGAPPTQRRCSSGSGTPGGSPPTTACSPPGNP